MPYIKQDERFWIDQRIEPPKTPGQLNYVFTKAILDYVHEKGLSYQTCNDVIGALTAASGEFYRRVVAPYENIKIKENEPDPYEEVIKAYGLDR